MKPHTEKQLALDEKTRTGTVRLVLDDRQASAEPAKPTYGESVLLRYSQPIPWLK